MAKLFWSGASNYKDAADLLDKATVRMGRMSRKEFFENLKLAEFSQKSKRGRRTGRKRQR